MAACGAAPQATVTNDAAPSGQSSADAAATAPTAGAASEPGGELPAGSQLAVTPAPSTYGRRDAGPLMSTNDAGFYRAAMRGCVLGEYFADTTFGSSGHFSMLVDSGSTTTAVASTQCANCGPVDRYDGRGGLTTGRRIGQAYGDGSYWKATVYADRMSLGTTQTAVTPAATVAFGAITEQGNDFFEGIGPCSNTEGADFDGILGLGPDRSLQPGTTSFLTQLMQSGAMAHDAFALTTCDVGGVLSVGGYDSSMVAEQPVFAALINNSSYEGVPYSAYYMLDLVAVGVGDSNEVLPLTSASLGPTLVDNGTNFTLLGSGLYRGVVAALAKDQNFRANFSSLYQNTRRDYEQSRQRRTRAQLDAELPPLVLHFTGVNDDVVKVRLPATRSYLLPVALDDSGAFFYFATLMDAQEDGPAVGTRILGNSVLRQHTVVFDRGNGRIGFAGNAGCSATLVPRFAE